MLAIPRARSHDTTPMNLRKTLLVVALASLLPVAAATAAGHVSYVPLRERLTTAQLRSTGISDVQIDALDALLRAASTRPGDAPSGNETAGPMRFVGLDAEGFTATVKGVVAGWSPGSVFELDNGQQWKVLKGSMALPKPRQSPRVRLVPGVSGRWFLEVDEDLPKARVYRID